MNRCTRSILAMLLVISSLLAAAPAAVARTIAAEPSIILHPSWFEIVTPFRYVESRRFEAGWNRGADVRSADGRIRTPVGGTVRFAGLVAGRRVVTVATSVGGMPAVVTFTGMDSSGLRRGDSVDTGDVIGAGRDIHVGAYDERRRTRYVPVIAGDGIVAPGPAGSPAAPAAVQRDPGTSPLSRAVARRIIDAIEGDARLGAVRGGGIAIRAVSEEADAGDRRSNRDLGPVEGQQGARVGPPPPSVESMAGFDAIEANETTEVGREHPALRSLGVGEEPGASARGGTGPRQTEASSSRQTETSSSRQWAGTDVVDASTPQPRDAAPVDVDASGKPLGASASTPRGVVSASSAGVLATRVLTKALGRRIRVIQGIGLARWAAPVGRPDRRLEVGGGIEHSSARETSEAAGILPGSGPQRDGVMSVRAHPTDHDVDPVHIAHMALAEPAYRGMPVARSISVRARAGSGDPDVDARVDGDRSGGKRERFDRVVGAASATAVLFVGTLLLARHLWRRRAGDTADVDGRPNIAPLRVLMPATPPRAAWHLRIDESSAPSSVPVGWADHESGSMPETSRPCVRAPEHV